MFTVSGLALDADTADILGSWTHIPPTDTPAVFALENAPTVPVWRASLPSDLRAAGSTLAGVERRQAEIRHRVDEAAHRLDELGSASFGVGTASQVNRPAEAELLTALRDLAPNTSPNGGWQALARNAQSTLVVLQRGLSAPGLVETEVAGRLVGRTLLGWVSGERTVWRSDCEVDAMHLHRRTVALTAAARMGLVRTVATSVRCATRVALLLGTPGGSLLALPTVVRFLAASTRQQSEG